MIKIRNAGKNNYSHKENIPSIHMRSIKLMIAAFVLTATIVLGPTSIQQQQQQVLAQQPPEPGSVLKLSRTNVPID
ncbi:MAG: hypothetical protein ACRD47_17075, partial [Nitrososphaeraceae archaeon]